MSDIHETAFVQNLFDEMSATYGTVNYLSSFGFTKRWRVRCLNEINWKTGETVVDLMSGMAESSVEINKRVGRKGNVIAIDYSKEMCERAERLKTRQLKRGRLGCGLDIWEKDALTSGLADGSADVVVSTFGLKTLTDEQINQLSKEVFRILKPGGQFSFLEISVPPNRFLRWPYSIYLKWLIPIVGKLFMGNAANYRLLSVYTNKFVTCEKHALKAFSEAGLKTELRSFFYSCATGLVGYKPATEAENHPVG